MTTNNGIAIVGFSLVTIMLVSVFAAMAPIGSAADVTFDVPNYVIIGDRFTLAGTANRSGSIDSGFASPNSLNLLIIGPKGYGSTLIVGDDKGIYNTIVTVAAEGTFSKEINVGVGVDTGRYAVVVLTPGTDGYYNGLPPGTSVNNFMEELEKKYNPIAKTQEQLLAIIEDATIGAVGGDDLMRVDYINVFIANFFDTGPGTYPSIMGIHNGTITPNQTITVSKLYTYPCSGTGGHTGYIKLWNSTDWNVTASWNGYKGDWHNITFDEPFMLYAGTTYNYTIRTGSYPQIIHENSKEVTGGMITCTEFVDANGKVYTDWIPAIKLIEEKVGPEPSLNCTVIWDNDVQITATNAESIFPTLGANGSTIHLAWVDQRDGGGNREIYYNRSTDSGTTWQASDTRISNDPSFSIKADFAVSGDVVHLFWRDDRDGNFEEYFIQSVNGGVSWGPETRITNDPGYSGCPFPVVNGDVINLFWRDDRLGTFKIYQKRSLDAGANWSSDTLLTPDGIQAEFPFPAVNGDTIHLVWRDARDENYEIYYKRSSDGGVSWTEDQRLTYNPAESEHPKIVTQGDTLHIVWRDNRDGNYEVYYKRSMDGGQNWSADVRLTNNSGQSFWPVLAVSNNLLHLLWCDDQDGTQALYYTSSSDRGTSWNEETRLSECIAPENIMGAHPIGVTDSYIHVVFNDDRTGENEIYYKRGAISCQ